MGEKSLFEKLDGWISATKFGKGIIKSNQLWLEGALHGIEYREKREMEEKEYLLWEYHKKILALDKFSGSMEDYKFLKPGNYQIIDTRIPEKRVLIRDYTSTNWYGSSQKKNIREFGLEYKSLFEQGLCGFIGWSGWHENNLDTVGGMMRIYNWGEGLPIRKIKS